MGSNVEDVKVVTPHMVKGAIDQCLVGDFSSIETLDMEFSEIIQKLEQYYNFPNNVDVEDKKKFAKDKGRLFEFIFKTGAFLKCNTITSTMSSDIILYENLKKCNSFSYTSGWKGASDEWGADVILVDKTTDIVWAFTAKSRQNITLGKTEWRQMLNLDKNLEFQNQEIAIGFIVNDKKEFMNTRSTQLGNYKHAIVDLNDLNFIWDECREIFKSYKWDLDKISESVRDARIPYILMPHQTEGENRAFNAFNAGEKQFLFFWKCRAGKTLAALDLLFRKMNHKNIILLTSYPSVNPEWTETVNNFMGFENVQVHDVSGSKISKIDLSTTKKNLVIVSTQDAVSGDIVDGKEWAKDKFENLEGVMWDSMILDEVHNAQETPKAVAVKSRVQYKCLLALSATPWKNIALGRFGRYNTHEWSIVDEGVAKNSNPKIYEKYPSMQFNIWIIDDQIKKQLNEYDPEEYPTMRKLFRVKDGKLYHENLIRHILHQWRQKISETNINVHNILAFLPETKCLEPLTVLMQDIFVNDYEVGYTNSNLHSSASDLRSFRNALYAKAANSSKGTIILAVGQLTTGITLKQCDCVMHLDDGVSTAMYIQKSLRSQNPEKGKDTCHIFDFNPNRALKCIYDTALGSHPEKNQKERVKDFLLNAAVQMMSDGKWVVLDADYLIKRGVEAQLKIDRNLFNRGIINDEVLESMKESDLYKQLEQLPYDEVVQSTYTNKPTTLDLNASGGGVNKTTIEVIPANSVIVPAIDPVIVIDTQEIEIEVESKDPVEKKPVLTMKQKIERLIVNFSWLPAITRFRFLEIDEIISYLDDHKEERKEFEALISRGDEKTTYPISWDYVKCLLREKDKFDRYLLDRDEINKRLAVLVMDCKYNPGKANELMISEDQYKKIFGEVFTPAELVNEMLDKLPVSVWSDKNLTWCDPACGSGNFLYLAKRRLMEGLASEIEDEKEREKWIVEKMLYGVELQRKNSYLCMFKLDPEDEFKLNIACEDSLKFDFWGMKFDVVVGNPPYNAPKINSGMRTGKASVIWPDFVKSALELLTDNGFLCFVHPPRWRKPEDKLWDVLKNYQFLYLSIHNVKDGLKVFGANTRYDFYVLQKSKWVKPCKIKDEDGNIQQINFSDYPFLPNGGYKEFEKIIARNADKKFDVLYTTSYHNNKDYVSRIKKDDYIYPCVNSTCKGGHVIFYSSKNDLGLFGEKKVIIGETGYDVPILDMNGEYATTESAFSFKIETQEDAALIMDDLQWFKDNLKYFLWLGYRIEYKIFKYLKLGFSKELVGDTCE